MRTPTWMIAGAAGLALAACTTRDEGDAADANAAADATVVREEVPAPTPSPTAPPQAAAIQTQPGPEGNSVALNKVAVTGDILTVTTTFSGGTCCVHLPVDQVSVIDDATSQRISVLKDNAGQYMAAPMETGGKTIGPANYDKPAVVWFKFPAPPATSRTVSIAIPGVAPFDAVPVTR